LIKTAREVLNWDVPFVISGVNASDTFVQLAGTENAEGVVTVLFGHQAWETEHPGSEANGSRSHPRKPYRHARVHSRLRVFGVLCADQLQRDRSPAI
jgi:hypothetical protein